MDDAFFQELDQHITNIGSDKVWKKTIGEVILWFTPINYSGESKTWDRAVVNERNALRETKRLALSHAIVGIGDLDLTKFRYAGAVFPMQVRNEHGQTVAGRVDLPKYIYSKIEHWDSSFVDIAYKVFADLAASHEKFLTREVTFENLKDPAEELAELEQRVAALRDELGLPQLVVPDRVLSEEDLEQGQGPDEEQAGQGEPVDAGTSEEEEEPPPPPEARARPKKEEDLPPPTGELDVQFDPFKAHPLEDLDAPDPVRSVPVPVPPSQAPKDPLAGLSPIERERLARTARKTGSYQVVPPGVSAAPSAGRPPGPTNTPETAYTGLPSVEVGVLEQPAERRVVPPPAVDKKPGRQSVNPRFQRPGG